MTPEPSEHVSILLVDPSRADAVLASLRSRFEVLEAATQTAAIRALKLARPSALVTELRLAEGDALAVCREAKSQNEPPSILVTTAIAQYVPAALIAGCDGVLMKPFPPNLLHTRLARLLRERAERLRQGSYLQSQKVAHLKERFEQGETGTNRTWSDTHCPSCAAGNAVSFDAAARRQMWFACLGCRHVWIAKPRAKAKSDSSRLP